MRIVKYLLFALLAFGTVAGCKKEKSVENGTLPEEELDHQWEFTADSLYKGTMDSAFLAFSDSGAIISLSGGADNGRGLLTIQLFNRDSISAGKYENQNLLFQYSEDGVVFFQNSLQQSDPFTVTINSIDSNSVSGIFSGVVQDGSGNVREITNGKFSAPFHNASNGGATDSLGTLMVWATAGCPLTDKTEVTITTADGAVVDTRQVTIAATQPDCGAPGTTSFSLPPGDYFVGVSCGDTAKTKVTITASSCTALQLDFSGVRPPPLEGDWFPLANRWTYGDPSSDDTLAIESTGPMTVDGQTYATFTNDATGEQRYYRKDDTAYYEYVSSFGGLPLSQPTELIFLKNDKPVGESWQSEEHTISISGISFTGKVRMTIVNSGFNAAFNGKMYYDLIEVKTELLVKQPNGSFDVADAITTVYAKGIGVVSFVDPSDKSVWPILHYDVVP